LFSRLHPCGLRVELKMGGEFDTLGIIKVAGVQGEKGPSGLEKKKCCNC
jgi:hypothetical protein